MPFGNKARSVRAYEFGCRDPIEGRDVVKEVMFRRVLLWNKLVELHGTYTAEKEALITPLVSVPNDKEHIKEYYLASREEGEQWAQTAMPDLKLAKQLTEGSGQ